MRIFKFIKKIVKTITYLIVIIFIITLVPALTGVTKCALSKLPEQAPVVKKAQAFEAKYSRPESSTYLTYPEWYIVYSSQEYARFLKTNLPSGFPYLSSIEQYWFGYCAVYRITRNKYEMNWGDHMMLIVIGTSLSAEYAIKSIYENTIGRLSEWSSSHQQVDEDHYAAKIAQEYADFIPYRPWFEFSFLQSLTGLWKDTSFAGSHMPRKLERKFNLSLEYSVKSVYASLIAKGSNAAYGTANQDTYVWIKNVPDNVFTTEYKNGTKVRMIRKINDKEYIAAIPHEQSFTDIVPSLAKEGVKFEDIAGNSTILVTAVVPQEWAFQLNEGSILFNMEILTQPDKKRIAISVPVSQLSDLLLELLNNGATIEHVYDY